MNIFWCYLSPIDLKKWYTFYLSRPPLLSDSLLNCNYFAVDPKYDDIKTEDCFSYPLTSYSTLGLNVTQMYGILTTPITETLHYQQHSKVKGVRLVIRCLNPWGLFTLQGNGTGPGPCPCSCLGPVWTQILYGTLFSTSFLHRSQSQSRAVWIHHNSWCTNGKLRWIFTDRKRR